MPGGWVYGSLPPKEEEARAHLRMSERREGPGRPGMHLSFVFLLIFLGAPSSLWQYCDGEDLGALL